MDNVASLMHGFSVALTTHHVLLMMAGVLLGVLVGVLPGLGAPNGVSLLLPLTFSMNPTSAIIMLSCIYWGALFGGAITSILFNIPGEPCPADCRFAACTRSTHEVCQDFNKLLNPERDYDAAVKEVCRFCEHFLEHGPGVAERTGEVTRQGNPNRFLL